MSLQSIDEVSNFNTSLTLKVGSHSHSKSSSELEKRLKAIEKLAKENELLQETLENLRLRLNMRSYPLLKEFCDARINNLEILEYNLSLKFFKRKERERIISMLIEGAQEIWQLGDERAARYLKDYLPQEEDEDEPRETFTEERNDFTEAVDDEVWEEIKSRTPDKEEDRSKNELKALYRELVKAFHPDKEMDETKKAEKNLLMKKITEAYERHDLFTLLKIEAQYLGLNETTESKISIYLKELNEKFKVLKQEKSMLTKWGPLSFIYRTIYSRRSSEIDSKIEAQLSGLKSQIQREESCSTVYSDVVILRGFLREMYNENDEYRDLYDF